jgi:hypothetical protein
MMAKYAGRKLSGNEMEDTGASSKRKPEEAVGSDNCHPRI